MAAEVASAPFDFVAIATNVGVGIGFAVAAITAIRTALKKLKESLPAENPTTNKVVGGMILDHTSMMMWSESNRVVGEKLDDLTDEMKELRFAVTQLKDKID